MTEKTATALNTIMYLGTRQFRMEPKPVRKEQQQVPFFHDHRQDKKQRDV